MNTTALKILDQINSLKIAGLPELLTIRRSVSTGALLAVLTLVKTPPKRDWSSLVLPELAGLVIKTHRADGSVEVVWEVGGTHLMETVAGVELRYPWSSFFQTNVPAFEKALERIMAAVPEGARVIDLYGGVGAIGLPVSRRAQEVMGVEVHPAGTEYAKMNADRMGIVNYRARAMPAEQLSGSDLDGADCIIVDPPRAGLHRSVVAGVLEAAPKRIIYLSCNPATQARDAALLLGDYRTKGVTGFDFYPGTLHLESLIVLERK
jgi:23S rRNA (uracil1939-C5)-methyltransferase